MTNKITNVKYLLFALTIYYVVMTASLYGDSAFILIILCLLLFSFLYRKEYRDTFLISFLVNVVFGCIMIGAFQKNGSFFDAGGDDQCPGYWTSDMQWHEGKFNPQEWMVANLIKEIEG